MSVQPRPGLNIQMVLMRGSWGKRACLRRDSCIHFRVSLRKAGNIYVNISSENTAQRINFCNFFKRFGKSKDNLFIFLIKNVAEYYLII